MSVVTPSERPGVAVVGIGCRFPGGITDRASLWRFLTDGGDAIGEVPSSRIDLGRFFDARPATPGRMMSRWGGYLDGIDLFDADFFGISPREAERLDPQQRLLLELAWEAFEDAGQDVSALGDRRCGVFVGQWLSDFEARLFGDPEAMDFLMTTGSGRYASSGRISYALGLSGPSMTIDSACSSSLVAVHLAAQSVRNGEAAMALAGGVNVILQPHISVAYSQSRMMAPDGRCKFGDALGDGYVRSEGAGLVLLKNLDLALEDGDRIYAVIRGSAANNDGRSSGSLGTPSRAGQEALLRTAYRDAGISPGSVGYVEAHGTGTRAGDPVELGALSTVLGEDRPAGRRGYVGSVKTNVGHTEGAAGVAGLIKAALALHHGVIPPSLHCKELNPSVPWNEMPLEIARSLTPWPDHGARRYAGVSAFGIAGTNAHAVLEAAPEQEATAGACMARKPALLPLSARSPQALRALAVRYAELLEAQPAPRLQDVCRTAATRRAALAHRAAFIAPDEASMAAALRRYADGEAADCEGTVYSDTPRIAFVFPGQGAQWIGMARGLAAEEAVFRAALERCDAAARRYVDWSILEQLHAEPGNSSFRLEQIDVIQPVLVAIAIAYTALWRALGVEPDAVVGHSMGEVGAAYVAGVLDLEQAMKVICRRSALMRRKSGMGAMAMVELPLEQARARLAGLEDRIVVAVNNGPRASVISGEPAAVAAVVADLEREQVFCRLVKVDVASHSPQMDSVATDLVAELDGLLPGDMKIPLFSTVLGGQAAADDFGANYWGENLRRPVLFFDTVKALLKSGVTVFVELGPHPILLPSIEQTAQSLGVEVQTIACGRRDEGERQVALAALGSLWAAGTPVSWAEVMPGGGSHVDLPLYPWQRERHWLEAAEVEMSAPDRRTAMAKPDAASLEWLYRREWRCSDPAPMPPMARRAERSWVVLADGLAAASAIAAGLISAGAAAQVASLGALEGTLEQCIGRTGAPAPTDILLLAGDGTAVPYLPVRAVQALARLPSNARPRLWFVTTGSQTVPSANAADGDLSATPVSVEHGALWGAARVVAEEQPELWGGLVDLDPSTSMEEGASLLARHLLAADGEDEAALRKDRRMVSRLVRHETPLAPLKLRADCAYLITGGLGDIGLGVARKMVEAGARRLVLLGRTPLPPRPQWSGVPADSAQGARISAIRSLEAAGVCVHTASVDVGDESQLSGFIHAYEAEAWPRIRGVVHAAGWLCNHLAGSMSRRDFDAVLVPKLRGAQLLDKLLPDLDLFVLFSSTGAFLAQPGQANYAAANAGLDALARDRHARGLPAVSIGWGVWENTGLVKGEAGRANVAEMARQGLAAFAPERGFALFGFLCGRDRLVASVLPMDWSRFAASRRGRPQPLYGDLLASQVSVDSPAVDLRARLDLAEPAQRLQLLQQVVLEAVARVLKIPASRIDPRKALGEMGLGSLMAMELRNRLESALGRPLSATLAWNYPTVHALCEHLADSGADKPQSGPGESRRVQERVMSEVASEPVAPPAGPPELQNELSEVSDMSDEDALLALRGGKRGSYR